MKFCVNLLAVTLVGFIPFGEGTQQWPILNHLNIHTTKVEKALTDGCHSVVSQPRSLAQRFFNLAGTVNKQAFD